MSRCRSACFGCGGREPGDVHPGHGHPHHGRSHPDSPSRWRAPASAPAGVSVASASRSLHGVSQGARAPSAATVARVQGRRGGPRVLARPGGQRSADPAQSAARDGHGLTTASRGSSSVTPAPTTTNCSTSSTDAASARLLGLHRPDLPQRPGHPRPLRQPRRPRDHATYPGLTRSGPPPTEPTTTSRPTPSRSARHQPISSSRETGLRDRWDGPEGRLPNHRPGRPAHHDAPDRVARLRVPGGWLASSRTGRPDLDHQSISSNASFAVATALWTAGTPA